MVDVVISVVAKVAELLVVPIGKHICYPFKYKSNMEELKKQVKKLTNAKERVQHSVDEATRQGEEIEKDVEQWLNSVDEFAEKVVKLIIDDEDKAGKLCSFGFFPNLMTRYLLSKKAAKTAKDGVNLLGEGKFKKVSYRPLLQKTTSIYTRGYDDFDSRKPIFNDLMEALTQADVNFIGVYGMGGVGKTTLVKRVVGQAIKDKLFDVVVMAEVTEAPDIRTIQDQIADELGLKFQEESLPGRAARLRERMKKEKEILVILDNVWAKLDLESIGIPLGGDEKGSITQKVDNKRQCKILLTSRNLDILRDDMNTQKNFLVENLSDVEAENLFWKTVGYSEEKSELKSTAVEIVGKCAGLPLAINTIANALKNKSISFWKNALDQLKRANPKDIKGMDAEVYSTIELSYKFLEAEEAKSLFLLCSLCDAGYGYGILVNDLLTYGVGMGLFQGVYTLEEARNKLNMLIDYLKTSCLLMDGDDGDNGDFVKMHDIIHAVAVSIASTTRLWFNLQQAAGLKEMLEKKLPKDSSAVSLPHRDIFELPENMEFPKLELFLLLMNTGSSLQIPDGFFEGMKGLKVLDMSGIHLLSPPSSLCCLINLHTLRLDRCQLGDVAIIGELKELEILSFLKSDIEQLPEEIRQLTRLRMLDLSNCSNLKVIKPNVISSLTRLEELRMGNSFVQWDVDGRSNANLAELKQLLHLTVLDIHVLNAEIIPQDLSFEKLERYRIFIGDVWDWPRKYEDLPSRTLKLKLNSGIHLRNEIKNLLSSSEEVYLDKLKGVKNVVYELNGKGFPQLKHLRIQNSPEVQYVIDSVRWSSFSVFPRLESLLLDELINLEKICHGQLATTSFSKLRIMKVRKCDGLKHLFSFSMVNNFLQLQEIQVADCEKLEEIICEESEKQVHQNESFPRIKFTQLRTLTLECLPQLTSFGFNATTTGIRSQEIVAEDEAGGLKSLFSQNVLLPSLENLKLSSINIECMWLDQLPAMSSCCQTLTSLTLEACSGSLKFLFSYSMVKSLVRLEKLEIRNCKSIERIIYTEKVRGDGKVVFPKLINLHLLGLPQLTQFGSGNSVEFSSMTQLSIKNCPKFKTFSYAVTFVDIKHSKEVEEMNCQDDILPLLDQKVVLPTLTFLNLSSIPIQTIWRNQLQPMSSCFQNLKEIIMHGCDTLKYVFSSSMVESLIHLEVLEISNCKIMEVVISIIGERISNTLFPKLYRLHVKHLPKLTSLYKFVGNSIELPSLAKLWIENCPKMHTFVSNSPHSDMPTSMEEHMNLEENLHSHIQPFFDEKVQLPNLEVLQLGDLEKLRKTWHHQLASDSFCKLEFFELYKCHNVLNVFPSNMLGRLQNLEELWLNNCSSLDEIFELQASSCEKTQAITATQLRKLGLYNLPKLKHVWDMDSQGLLTCQNLLSIEVTRCDTLKSILPASVGRNLLHLEELWIENCSMVEEIFAKEEELDEAVPRFPQLTFLRLADLSTLRSFYPGVNVLEWPMLKRLQVWNCNRVEISASKFLSFQVIDVENQHEMPMGQPPLLLDKVPLTNLESLGLDWKWFEKEALHEKLPEYSCKLKFLTVRGFHKTADICVFCFLHKLPNLEKLQVSQGFFKEVFLCEGLICEEEHVEAPSKLSHLRLFNLFDSLHLWEENSLSSKVFQSLEILVVIKCGNLKSLVPSSVSFQNLTTLEVLKCNKLLNLVAVPTAKSLVQLTKLIVSKCKMIEEIITHEGDEVEDRIIFKNLSYLELQCLPSLTSFYSGNYTIEFPSLTQVSVRECPNIKIFSQGVLSAPRLCRIQTSEAEGDGFWEGNLNTTIQHMFTENGQSSKEDD
ncbi:hypothetical protein ACOSQ2_030233 [Xanthoceras sorbifolium]